MSLSCSCNEYDGDGWSWGWTFHDDFTELKTKYRRRCCSCGKKINVGDQCLMFGRFRGARDEVELNIYGEDYDAVDLASWYMCEECGEIFLNLDALGYCIALGDDNMHDLLEEYHELTGWKKSERI